MTSLMLLVHVLLCLPMQVDLRLEPAQQTAVAGQDISIDLVAHGDLPASITAIDAILSWDPNRLQLLNTIPGDFPPFVAGFLPDPDGINADTSDGEALYTALAPLTTPATVPPDLLVVTFVFKVLTSACVGLTPAVGTFGKTRVIGIVPGVEITGSIAGPVSLEVPGAWADLGGSIAGTGGLTPQLEGDGILLPCEPWSLTLSDGPSNTTAYLVLGATALNLPFKGGVIVPNLDILLMLPSGPTGDLVLSGPWPVGIPPGLTAFAQYWFVDPGAVKGYSASNGVSATTP